MIYKDTGGNDSVSVIQANPNDLQDFKNTTIMSIDNKTKSITLGGDQLRFSGDSNE